MIFIFVGALSLNGLTLACGPYSTTPVFEFDSAPESPFENFAAGNLGIIKPTMRRAALFAAYRYLNNGAFTADEQRGLVEVWRAEFGKHDFADSNINQAVEIWIAARAKVADKNEKLPEIYTESKYGDSYDFFPNCAKFAFETAVETLNQRVTEHGADDANVKNWIAAQDAVFANCNSSSAALPEIDNSQPEWLRKDRAYQSAAADFYALRFDDAKRKFAHIAADNDSTWQATADYLIGRTLTREASVTKNEQRQRQIYDEAETQLQIVVAKSSKYADAARKLLNLIHFRTQPEQRARELVNELSYTSDAGALRQNLVDYSWLLDKFEKDALNAEEARKNPKAKTTPTTKRLPYPFEEAEAGKQIEIYFIYQKPSKPDVYDSKSTLAYFAADASDDEIVQKFATQIKRDLTAEEIALIKQKKAQALKRREEFLAGNNQLKTQRESDYPGVYYGDEKLKNALIPDFVRSDDLTDWLYVYQLQDDADAFAYAVEKWRATNSAAWLLAAMSKADKNSKNLAPLLDTAAKIGKESPAFLTVNYHTARLLIEAGKTAEARKMLDQILTENQAMPISARNQFFNQRAAVADGFDEFLRYAQRRPFGFCFGESSCGDVETLIGNNSFAWTVSNPKDKTKEQIAQEVRETYKDYLLWQNRQMFDDQAIAVFNQQLPLALWYDAAHSPQLPEYLRREIVFTGWTRAVLTGNADVEAKFAAEVVKQNPALATLFAAYLNAKTAPEKHREAVWILLKIESATPILTGEIFAPPVIAESKDDYRFEQVWWCIYSEESAEKTTANDKKLNFLTPAQKTVAREENARLAGVEAAPEFFGAEIIKWTKAAPADRRLPEALFIASRANDWTKYGCGNNEEIKNQLEAILRSRFPQSKWTAKLDEKDEN